MSVEVGFWRIDGVLEKLTPTPMPNEALLEEILEKDVSILGLNVLVIGRQTTTSFGGRIDLLGIDAEGSLTVIELKRNMTPRDVVAQALDYGSWVVDLGFEDVVAIHNNFDPTTSFEEAFTQRFGASPPDALNESHSLVIVAAELDSSTERIVTYLNEQYGVAVNAVFFRYFEDGDHQYLARTWLIDPKEAEGRTQAPGGGRKKEQPWNGEDFYVSFGDDGTGRSWEDAVKYGFVSGGGGPWYSRSLNVLQPGKRVFVHLPGEGYVGVGIVTSTSAMAKDFVPTGYDQPLFELPLSGSGIRHDPDDPDKAEWVVGVEWVRSLARTDAIWEQGMFANQNTACKMRSQFTIERLTERFSLSS
jgi:hypothetical protein